MEGRRAGAKWGKIRIELKGFEYAVNFSVLEVGLAVDGLNREMWGTFLYSEASLSRASRASSSSFSSCFSLFSALAIWCNRCLSSILGNHENLVMRHGWCG